MMYYVAQNIFSLVVFFWVDDDNEGSQKSPRMYSSARITKVYFSFIHSLTIEFRANVRRTILMLKFKTQTGTYMYYYYYFALSSERVNWHSWYSFCHYFLFEWDPDEVLKKYSACAHGLYIWHETSQFFVTLYFVTKEAWRWLLTPLHLQKITRR